MYGAGIPKVQKMTSSTYEEAEKLFNGYWDAVPSLKQLKDDLENYWSANGKRYVKAIDGRKLMVRSYHALLNVLLQGSGSIMAKWSIINIARILSEENLLGNPFTDKKNEVKIYQCICYHK